MDVSDPVSEKFQRCELLRLARVVGRQDFKVPLDCRHDAGRCTWAALGKEPIRISRQVQEVLACSLPGMIWSCAGIAEGVEPVVGADQLLDLGARVGLDQAKGYFTDDFVTLIAPAQASLLTGKSSITNASRMCRMATSSIIPAYFTSDYGERACLKKAKRQSK